MFPRSLEQDMCSINICMRELVRVAKAEVNMRLRRKMDNGVGFVSTEHTLHSSRRGDVALLECEVRSAIENARVVECCAVVQFVQGNHIIVGVRKD